MMAVLKFYQNIFVYIFYLVENFCYNFSHVTHSITKGALNGGASGQFPKLSLTLCRSSTLCES